MTGTMCLFVLMLQAVPASEPSNARISLGPFAGATAIGRTDIGGLGVTVGGSVGLPLGRRITVDVRAARFFPESAYGFYDARAKVTFGSTDVRDRKYVAIGVAGILELDDPLLADAPRHGLDIKGIDMVSTGVGFEAAVTRHFILPADFTVLWRRDGAAIGLATVGIHWSPQGRRLR